MNNILNPLESLKDTLVFSSKDYGEEKEEIYQEFNKKFGWDRSTWERLQLLHEEFEKLKPAIV